MNKIKKFKIVLIICLTLSILIISTSKTYAVFLFNDTFTQETSTSYKTNTSMLIRLISALKNFKKLQDYLNNSNGESTENEEDEIFKTAEDSDGDGLLDNTAQYVNNQMIAPIDPDPLVANSPIGVWQKQVQIEKEGNIPNYLTDFYTYDEKSLNKKNLIDWGNLKQSRNIYEDSLNSNDLLEIVSNVLNFRLDNGGVVLHSQTQEEIYDYMMAEAEENLSYIEYLNFKAAVEYLNIKDKTDTWQKKYGYLFMNNIY